MKEAEVPKNKPNKGPFFENLKNINPKYSPIRNNSTQRRNSKSKEYCQKSDTRINDKRGGFCVCREAKEVSRLGSNQESDLHNEPNFDSNISHSLCSENLSQNSLNISSDHKTSLKVSDEEDAFYSNNTETCNDDIVIFERTEYKRPQVPVEKAENVSSSRFQKDDVVLFERTENKCPQVPVEKTEQVHSCRFQNVLKILMIILIMLPLIWSFLSLIETHSLFNLLKIKTKRQPTNYELSLLFIKNFGRLISSGVDYMSDMFGKISICPVNLF